MKLAKVRQTARHLGRQYFLPCWWLLFAGKTLEAANNPGYVMHPENVRYPWRGVLLVWLLLAVESAVLFAIVRPQKVRPWRRVGAAAVLFGILSAPTAVFVVTDMPGLYYVPGSFHFATFAVLIGILVARMVVDQPSEAAA